MELDCVDSISADMGTFTASLIDFKDEVSWNGRTVSAKHDEKNRCLHVNDLALLLQEESISKEELQKSSPTLYVTVGGSGSVDTDGNAKIDVHVGDDFDHGKGQWKIDVDFGSDNEGNLKGGIKGSIDLEF